MANRQRPARATREGAQALGAQASAESGRQSLQFSKVNLAFGTAGFVSLVLGYWLLSGGSITAAPLLLVLGYVVLLPLALIL